MKLLAVIDSAKELAMDGCDPDFIALALDLHIAASRRIVEECEAHKAKLEKIMEAS